MTGKSLFHESVLSQEVLSKLISAETKSVFEGTLGLGGHTELILNNYPQISLYLATELDEQHLNFAKKRLHKFSKKLKVFRENFVNLKNIIKKEAPERPLVIFLDLGLCSNQIDDNQKGFSFSGDGPLKMAFDGHDGAKKILNTANEQKLSEIIQKYGEEPLAKKIARAVLKFREKKELQTTGELREIIENCVHPTKRSKALTRVFQAIRIAVNDELNILEKTIDNSFEVMEIGDKLGIISYHSLEDRLVKNKFKKVTRPLTQESQYSLHEIVAEPNFKLLTKKPLKPSTEEISRNPRSRSAVFRIVEKIK